MSDRPNMSNDKSANHSSSVTSSTSVNKRRSSFAGETFASLFGTNRRSSSGGCSADNGNAGIQQSSPGQQQSMGPITSAATNARRLSMGTMNNGSTSPSQSTTPRRDASVGAAGIEESAVEDEPASGAGEVNSLQKAFARRMSSSARALRDGRSSMAGGSSGLTANDTTGSPKEGFNWSDNFRTRAERTSSIAATNPPSFTSGIGVSTGSTASAGVVGHARANSVASMEISPAKTGLPPQPDVVKPAPTKERPRPDHFQERILKGDFYMD